MPCYNQADLNIMYPVTDKKKLRIENFSMIKKNRNRPLTYEILLIILARIKKKDRFLTYSGQSTLHLHLLHKHVILCGKIN